MLDDQENAGFPIKNPQPFRAAGFFTTIRQELFLIVFYLFKIGIHHIIIRRGGAGLIAALRSVLLSA